MERRSTVDGGVGPDTAPVAMNNTVDDGQADAGSFEIFGAMQALENAEELVRKTHVEAGAIVPYRIGALRRIEADGHGRRVAAARVLESIGEKIDPDLLEQ